MIDPKADFIIVQNDKTQITYTYSPKIGWVAWSEVHFENWKYNVEFMEKNPDSLKELMDHFADIL